MSADAWRLVRIRRSVRPARPPSAAASRLSRLKATVRRVLGPVAERLRGRLGVRVLSLPGRVLVLAESVDALRSVVYLNRPAVDRRVVRVTIRVLWWRGPWRGWSGRMAPVRHMLAERVSLPRGGRGPAIVDLRVEWPVPARDLLAAAERALRPLWPMTGPEVTSADSDRVLVDAVLVNPRGRTFAADRPGARRFSLVFDPGWKHLPSLQPWRRGRGDALACPAISALRTIGVIDCSGLPGRDPRVEASLLVKLAMTGVVVCAPAPPAGVRELLAPPLQAILAEPLDEADGLGLELRSVQQRRCAMRWHSKRFGATHDALPSVSALLATRRPEHLPRILPAIASQTYPNLEIVLCLHGIDLPEPALKLLEACGRPYEVVRVDGDVPFGAALGIATARAGGTLLTKFDDDDTYGPEHVWDLVLARAYAAATLVGKGAEFVYLEDAAVTVRRWSGRPEWEDNMVAGGTLLIGTADLEELGGWRPVSRSVDRGLFDRVNRAGATIYRTHPLGYVYHRRPQGHTWDPGTEYFLRNTRHTWDGLVCPDG
jgi:hypothetical protein